MSRFLEKYKSEVAPALMAKFGYKTVGDKKVKVRLCSKCGAEI